MPSSTSTARRAAWVASSTRPGHQRTLESRYRPSASPRASPAWRLSASAVCSASIASSIWSLTMHSNARRSSRSALAVGSIASAKRRVRAYWAALSRCAPTADARRAASGGEAQHGGVVARRLGVMGETGEVG